MINNLQFDDMLSSLKVTVVTLLLPMVISPGNCSNLCHISYFAKMFVMDQVVIFQYTHIHYAHMSYKYLYY